MKNKEKYRELILAPRGDFCETLAKPIILKDYGLQCTLIGCDRCRCIVSMWLEEEYKEINWENVPLDTKILVRNGKDEPWKKRYFSKFEGGYVYAFKNGGTSWNCKDHEVISWDHAKLAEEEE